MNKFNANNYPVLDKLPDWADKYFKNEGANVAGMAIGGGLNGVDGDRTIIVNPYHKDMSDSTKRSGLIKLEALRHFMDETKYSPKFSLTDKQKKAQKSVFKGTKYENDDNAYKQSILSRIYVGDEAYEPSDEQREELNSLIGDNKNETVNFLQRIVDKQ